MINSYIFFNTKVENSGALAWIGDKGLAPFRCLFNGKSVFSIYGTGSRECMSISIPRASFSSTGMFRTAFSVILLIPGLILGAAFKGLAYLFSDVRKRHSLVRERLTPIDRTIGNVLHPIKSRVELGKVLAAEWSSGDGIPTNALIIYGDGTFTINKDPGILRFNPMKLILSGTSIASPSSSFVEDRIGKLMRDTGKWLIRSEVGSVDEALRALADRRSWTSCKRYHTVFEIVKKST